MKHRPLLTLFLATVSTALIAVQGVHAGQRAQEPGGGGNRIVFVQTNEPAGNKIVVYNVAARGHLARAGTYATGGNGGIALPGDESDRLASQGSLVYDPAHKLLIAVNAGSDSVSTFSVDGDRLRLRSIVASGGGFPASIAVHGKLVYVLNSGGSGVLQGFRIRGDRLRPIPDSARSLGLDNTDPPNFLTSPGQVGFTPDGRQLIVTTKAGRNTIEVFQVASDGRLSIAPVSNPAATPVPFAFTFTPSGRLAVGEAGTSTLTTYQLMPDGTLTDPKSQSDGQVALCWIHPVAQFYYVSNTGSNTLSAFRISPDGQPSLLATATAVVASTPLGPIDLTSPSGTRFLYAQIGSGTVEQFRVDKGGSLTSLGVIGGLPPGMEGIAST